MSEGKKKRKTENKIIDISRLRASSFSPEEMEDPEIDVLIRESLKLEADLLEEELNNDPELMGVGASDDLFLSIVNKLKEQGAWEESEEETMETAEDEKAETVEAAEDEKPGAVKTAGDEKPGAVETAEDENLGVVETSEDDNLKVVDEAAESVHSVDNHPKKEESCVKQEDIYQMLPEEDLQALMLGREMTRQKEAKKIQKQRQRRRMRQIASVAAVFVLVFMVGMSSDANRRLALKAWDAVMTMTGFKVMTDYTESEHTLNIENEEEKQAWEDAAERLGITALDFTYLPKGMEFEQYEVMEIVGEAIFMYSYQENMLNVKVMNNQEANSIYYAADENAKLQDCITIDKDVTAEIWNITSDSGLQRYIAEFEYKDCRYVINGVVSLGEMKEIIKNTIFL